MYLLSFRAQGPIHLVAVFAALLAAVVRAEHPGLLDADRQQALLQVGERNLAACLQRGFDNRLLRSPVPACAPFTRLATLSIQVQQGAQQSQRVLVSTVVTGGAGPGKREAAGQLPNLMLLRTSQRCATFPQQAFLFISCKRHALDPLLI